MTRDHRPIAATCTFALRLPTGFFVEDPVKETKTSFVDCAYVWLWPASESDEARAERIAKVVERYPWIVTATAVRARAG